MNLWKIHCFLEVAEERSISAAAKKMHISQPPLSRHIKTLEEEIGVPLFIRNPSGLVLTEAGKLLRERGKELVELYSKTVSEMKEISKGNNKIIIGANDGAKRYIAPVFINFLKNKFKNTEIIQYTGICEEIADALIAQEIDIAFLRAPLFFNEDKFDIIELGEEKWIALISKNYSQLYHWSDSIPLGQLIEHPLILPSRPSLYLPLVDALTVNDKEPNVICYYFEKERAVELINSDVGIALVPSCIDNIVDNHNYIKKEIDGIHVNTCYVAIKLKGDYKSEILRELWNYIARKGHVY